LHFIPGSNFGLRREVDREENSFEAGHRVRSFTRQVARSSPSYGVLFKTDFDRLAGYCLRHFAHLRHPAQYIVLGEW
jgi:hypothetical protein